MWKDGVLVVQGQSFDELIENISSWYGVEIINLTTVSQRERFNGRFDREDIQVAIEAVSISAKIKYRVHEGKLVLEDR
jgi:ferric-dicitrate binding protein FerR (iron transport regulator)